MSKKYLVQPGYEHAEVIVSPPSYPRPGGARFILSACSQRDLRYLYEVVKYGGVKPESDEKTGKQSKN